MFTTIKYETGTYKVKTDKVPEFTLALAKASKIRRRGPLRGGVARVYPANGHYMSTAAYVFLYQARNSGALIRSWDWAPLSEHVSVPEGVDSQELDD